MVSVSQQAAKAPQHSMEMTAPSTGRDTKEKPSSRKSLDSQASVLPDIRPTNKHSKNAVPTDTTGEPAIEQADRSHLVANEDYSVFTVGQKRAIIFAGSFAAWFSPMVCYSSYTLLRTTTDLS